MKQDKKITKEMTFEEILSLKKEKAAEILFGAGMHCIGCPSARYETLEQGCLSHGMSKKQIEEIIKKLNGGK